ncbi:LuxR family maltose regulon positive regulatory protein [Jatrophihabitans sp. GAS493]|uniref:LuxR C-terminal-related transcriptional regulator n=1 Tax=Jatrophihabitans sp. GAS493 TaxID=1907575 RepID=UPI000BB703A7|nr:LuxR C-terminal-related transcriptional regulator [Jatrophihabitans sp. GAS493]SOD74888.1 LuxR family maltose regulon positive regulatory protein [Jatrophihabitans sp. GAS493]
MDSPLVETKLHIPQSRPTTVPRPHLLERLSHGAESRLILISAPAGFGKTTLLAEWMTDRTDLRVAWVSLEANDQHEPEFWSYVVTALHRAVPVVGSTSLALLKSGASLEAVLTTLVNELSTAPEQIILVLDDYHLVDGPDLQVGMAFLLDHLPAQAHLVISSRADPALPLARLRARGELLEVRAADLRFTLDEVSAYLNEIIGLDLSADAIATLEGRTEGWIAALQLAAISLQGRSDVTDFIAGFAGDDRFVVDYLAEEVLERQPDQVRAFLLQTSILDRLNGSLCDAVTGRSGGKVMLEALDHANLFVIGLDDNRRWYRYHHLFADVLHAYLLDEHAAEVAELHSRASRWYAENDQQSLAIRHAVAAGDVDRAAALIELALPALRRDRHESTVLSWLDDIPDDVVRLRPVLAVGFIGALMAGNQFDDIDRRLQEVEECLQTPPAGTVVVDQAELVRLPGAIETFRAALSLGRGDPIATVRHARLGIERAADGDHLIRAAASGILGLALWSGGDLEGAHQAYSVCVEGLQRAGHISDIFGCSITLADIRLTQGRLGDAQRSYEWALQLSPPGGGSVLRGTADMYVGLSQIAVERDDLPAAAAQLARAEELGEQGGLPQNAYRFRAALARLRHAEGDLAGALTLLEAAERVYVGDFSPNVRPLAASKARVLAELGRVDEAHTWAREHAVTAGDDLAYAREFEHITLARVLLSPSPWQSPQQRPAADEAVALLDRLAEEAATGGRTGNLIEIRVLQAIAHQAMQDLPTALLRLEQALSLAEPEGYVRVFADEGASMTLLLKAIAKRRPHAGYVRRLLESHAGGVPAKLSSTLVDPLSDRELDILRLLTSDLTGPDIARHLSISLNTVRTHTRNIFTKLGVTSRRAAVRRASELGLLSRHPT